MKNRIEKLIVVFLLILINEPDSFAQNNTAMDILNKAEHALGMKVQFNILQKFGKRHSYFIDQSTRPDGHSQYGIFHTEQPLFLHSKKSNTYLASHFREIKCLA